MKKYIFYAYALIWLLIIPAIIALGVSDIIMKMYENYSRHWIAGAAVCLLTGAVASWFPMAFVADEFRFADKGQLKVAALIGWVGGIAGPLFFGFNAIGYILVALLLLTTLMTASALNDALKEASRR